MCMYMYMYMYIYIYPGRRKADLWLVCVCVCVCVGFPRLRCSTIISPELRRNFARTSNWSALKKGITATQPSHIPGWRKRIRATRLTGWDF